MVKMRQARRAQMLIIVYTGAGPFGFFLTRFAGCEKLLKNQDGSTELVEV